MEKDTTYYWLEGLSTSGIRPINIDEGLSEKDMDSDEILDHDGFFYTGINRSLLDSDED